MTLTEIEKLAAVAATAGGIVWACWKHILKPYIAKVRGEKKQLAAHILEIRNELRFNGGNSIKDYLYKVDTKVDNIADRLSGIEVNQRRSFMLNNVAYWESNEKGEFIYVSPILCKILGRSESELLENGWMGFIHQQDKERVIEAYNISYETHSAFDETYLSKRADGRWVKVWSVAFPMVSKYAKMGKLVQIEEPFAE